MKNGSTVRIKTAVIKGRKKLVPNNYEGEHEIRRYVIILVPNESLGNFFYSISIDHDMVGWIITRFHTTYLDVPEKYLNTKFFDVNEDYFCK